MYLVSSSTAQPRSPMTTEACDSKSASRLTFPENHDLVSREFIDRSNHRWLCPNCIQDPR